MCGSNCVDTQSNLANCGSCNSVCSGYCDAGGCLTAGVCSAGEPPTAEICDGRDNNCDGVTDEPISCDDGNSCTLDACDSGVFSCTHILLSDGTNCITGGAPGTCNAGICLASP